MCASHEFRCPSPGRPDGNPRLSGVNGERLRDAVGGRQLRLKPVAGSWRTRLSLVLPECDHYPAEEAPEAMPAALTAFLAPYRDGRTASDVPGRGPPKAGGADGL